jgi:hypothetical protein
MVYRLFIASSEHFGLFSTAFGNKKPSASLRIGLDDCESSARTQSVCGARTGALRGLKDLVTETSIRAIAMPWH